MHKGQRIGVVIPALDEEQAIGLVIADIPDSVDEIVVVDNGSRDGTAAAARAAGARVVYERERGYGAACQAGIRALEGSCHWLAHCRHEPARSPSATPTLWQLACVPAYQAYLGCRL
jgi:glycosyltransferase involved in cell wall biosynthesis